MTVHEWSGITEERLNPSLSRQVIHTGRMTIARLQLTKGAHVPAHSHMHEQVTMLIKGQLRFTIDGQEQIVVAGQLMQIPPNALHSVDALEDSVAVDLFAPVREDWVRGDDAYLRR